MVWVSGTCAKLFKSEVQFGHAGARSTGESDSAQVCWHSEPGASLHQRMFWSACSTTILADVCRAAGLLQQQNHTKVQPVTAGSNAGLLASRYLVHLACCALLVKAPAGDMSKFDVMSCTVLQCAQAKNAALAAAGAIVPDSFEGLEVVVRETYNRLVQSLLSIMHTAHIHRRPACACSS